MAHRGGNETPLCAMACSGAFYGVSERKLGFFVKVKEEQNFNRRNILNIFPPVRLLRLVASAMLG